LLEQIADSNVARRTIVLEEDGGGTFVRQEGFAAKRCSPG
jgi:hypothetical protein